MEQAVFLPVLSEQQVAPVTHGFEVILFHHHLEPALAGLALAASAGLLGRLHLLLGLGSSDLTHVVLRGPNVMAKRVSCGGI